MSIFRAIGWFVVIVFGFGYFFGGGEKTSFEGSEKNSVKLEPVRPNVIEPTPVATTPSPPATPRASPPPSTLESGEMIATLINLSGNLCARVQAVAPLKLGGGRVFEVECIEYRGGLGGTVLYVVDTRNGSVIRSR